MQSRQGLRSSSSIINASIILFIILASSSSSSSAHPVAVLTDANFKTTVNDGHPWLIEFYAPWCGHCKRLEPILDEVAPKLGDKLRIGKVDTTVHKRVANEYGIQAYPTLKVLRSNEPHLEYDGARTPEAFIEFADRLSGKEIF